MQRRLLPTAHDKAVFHEMEHLSFPRFLLCDVRHLIQPFNTGVGM